MYRSRDQLHSASDEELLDFSSSRTPTLRQMHAIEDLAGRALKNPQLLDVVATLCVQHLSPDWRMGGLPVGYLGAHKLYQAEGPARASLLTALATVPPQVRDDLLRWMTESGGPAPGPVATVEIEREVVLDHGVAQDTFGAVLAVAIGRRPRFELMTVSSIPEMIAVVALQLREWEQLDLRAEQIAKAWNSTVYLWPPAEYYWVHPDLRLAVTPDGRRYLVVLQSSGLGYSVQPFDLARSPEGTMPADSGDTSNSGRDIEIA